MYVNKKSFLLFCKIFASKSYRVIPHPPYLTWEALVGGGGGSSDTVYRFVVMPECRYDLLYNIYKVPTKDQHTILTLSSFCAQSHCTLLWIF